MKQIYFDCVDLLLTILPTVMKDERIALKGGTAINIFVFDMPRLSVDIDLTYLPIQERSISLITIDEILLEVMNNLLKKRFSVHPKLTQEGNIKQLVVNNSSSMVKVEINHILRGHVHPPVKIDINKKPLELFNKFMSIQCLSEYDLFAGKICATLDRQHPRDLYDIHYFLTHKEYDRKLHETFIVYLISHNRPISELIKPNQLDISNLYNGEFKGMTDSDISIDELNLAFNKILKLINSSMTAQDKEFLMSFKAGSPRWELLPFDHIKDLPAIKWKLHNIKKMDPLKHRDMLKKLEKKLQ